MCSRPAVSISTVSTPGSMPSLDRLEGHARPGRRPRGRARSAAPTRSPQVCSWSAAAARKVSAAPSTTVRPSPTRTRASLPQVVVLPVPFTPTMSRTGRLPLCGAVCSDRSSCSHAASSSSLAQQRPQLLGPAGAQHLDLGAQVVDHLPGRVTPTSAVMRTSSTSSQVSSSSRSRTAGRAGPSPASSANATAGPAAVTSRPAEGAGARCPAPRSRVAGVSGRPRLGWQPPLARRVRDGGAAGG